MKRSSVKHSFTIKSLPFLVTVLAVHNRVVTRYPPSQRGSLEEDGGDAKLARDSFILIFMKAQWCRIEEWLPDTCYTQSVLCGHTRDDRAGKIARFLT